MKYIKRFGTVIMLLCGAMLIAAAQQGALSTQAVVSALNAVMWGGVTIGGTPDVGYVPTATSATTAVWRAQTGGSGGAVSSVDGRTSAVSGLFDLTAKTSQIGAGALGLPDGTPSAPALYGAGQTGDGIFWSGTAGDWGIVTNGVESLRSLSSSTANITPASWGTCWGSAGVATPDTCLWRDAAGAVYLGNATENSTAGTFRTATLQAGTVAATTTISAPTISTTSGGIRAYTTVTGSNIRAGEYTPPYSTNPVCTFAYQICTLTISGNVSFTITGASAGQQLCILLVHDPTSNSYTVTPPPNVPSLLGGTFLTMANASERASQCFEYSGSQSIWIPDGNGASNY